MARVSPASRLVAAALLGMVVVLYALGSARPASPTPTLSPDTAAAATTASPANSTSEPSESGGSPPTTPSASASDAPTAPPMISARPTATTTPKPVAACTPTDQDRYVYNPSRLEVLEPCIRVTGTVEAVRHEADGDLHILLALDPPYRSLLRPANQGEELGDLVVEPVCVRGVTQADAIDVCASDPDPMPGPFPAVGQHVWMEGRYVLDLQHGGWAELHPLYRWGT